MDNTTLIRAFADYVSSKHLDHPTMTQILEDVFRSMIKRKYGRDSNFEITINIDEGTLEIVRTCLVIADEVENFDKDIEIPLREALKIQPDFKVGEKVTVELIDINVVFGRRLVQTAYQTLIQRVRELETSSVYDKYKDLVGDIISGEVYQVLPHELIILDEDRNELSLPKGHQIYKDRFRRGAPIRAVVHEVENNNGRIKIILSRASSDFLKRLFELEIPEVEDGTVVVRKVVRIPGDRSKVMVESFDERIDPVGTCVGVNGSRIRSIYRELCQENIDIINYSEDAALLIKRSLAPAQVADVKIGSDGKKVSVFMDKEQISLAIGKGGANINLASELTGFEIDIFRKLTAQEEVENEEDVELSEFLDVIDEWVIDEFKKIGFDTAKTVLSADPEDLAKRTDLEDETIDFVLDVLRKEFE